jgi:hypothetical protein
MNRKLRNKIRSIILEQVDELFSDSDDTLPTRLSSDSVDDQIDSFILKFEKDSIDNRDAESMSMNESLESLSLNFLLEQEEDPEEEEETDPEIPDDPEENPDADFDTPAPDDPGPAGSEDVDSDVEAVEKLPRPALDVDAFTKRIARLAMNYDSLIDIKSTIVSRAMNFILDNYDKEHVEEMREILDTQFDFDLNGSEDIPNAPYAVGANPAGAGLSGGGG